MAKVHPIIADGNQKREYNPQTDYISLLTQPVTNVSGFALPFTITDEFIVNVKGEGTVFLPSEPLDGQLHSVRHDSSASPSDTVTVDGNGNNINGQSDVDIKTHRTTLQFHYNSDDEEWMII